MKYARHARAQCIMQPDYFLAAGGDKAKDLNQIGPSGWAVRVVPKLMEGGGKPGLGQGVLDGGMALLGLDSQEGSVAAGLLCSMGQMTRASKFGFWTLLSGMNGSRAMTFGVSGVSLTKNRHQSSS